MSLYDKHRPEGNRQLESDFESALPPEVAALYARKIASSKGISVLHAQAVLAANNVIGDRDA